MAQVVLYDITDAADYLSVTRATLYRWIDGGEINGLVFGGTYYIELGVLEQFIEDHPDDYEQENGNNTE
ncbi:unnamed protein product [marine sediment metagenome]|uniref:Helix-turn-helix domain-containing protein n=1 Tax=marine sediment metagenome TaxID=412755 RepID=X1JAG6_9ZZZZ